MLVIWVGEMGGGPRAGRLRPKPERGWGGQPLASCLPLCGAKMPEQPPISSDVDLGRPQPSQVAGKDRATCGFCSWAPIWLWTPNASSAR